MIPWLRFMFHYLPDLSRDTATQLSLDHFLKVTVGARQSKPAGPLMPYG